MAIISAMFLLSLNAEAVSTDTWTGATSNIWNVGTNWNTSAYPGTATSDIANFNNSSLVGITGLGASVSLGGIVLTTI